MVWISETVRSVLNRCSFERELREQPDTLNPVGIGVSHWFDITGAFLLRVGLRVVIQRLQPLAPTPMALRCLVLPC